MFLSKEEREARKKREAEIQDKENRLKDLTIVLETSRRKYAELLETYKQSQSEKWEYLEVSSEHRQRWGSLDKLGSMGWELVGLATYAVGDVPKYVHTQYVFKRRLPEEFPEGFHTLLEEIRVTERELSVHQRVLMQLKQH